MSEDLQRLERLLELVNKEDEHLLAVRRRLLGEDCRISPERIKEVLATETGVDRLESFGAKFGRMQDTMIDKLIPALLRSAGEEIGAAIDNLGRLERLGLIGSVDEWLQMRRLRNSLVHEYMEQTEDMAPALETACQFTDRMHTAFEAVDRYAQDHLLNR